MPGILLAAVAAPLWAVGLALALWLEAHPFAPTGLVVASFVLALVVLPVTVGAATAWWWHPRAHQDRVSAWAAVAAEWALLIVAAVVSLVSDHDKQIAAPRNLNDLMEPLLVLGIFGVAGAIMGSAGGAVVVRVRRGRPTPTTTPHPLGAAL